METVHSTATLSWGHEITRGNKFVPPTDDELIEVVDENGEVTRVPKEGWQPRFETINLDTVVIADTTTVQAGAPVIFKFSFDKAKLAEFLTTYVEHLDAEGRQTLREALGNSSDIVIPEGNFGQLKLIP